MKNRYLVVFWRITKMSLMRMFLYKENVWVGMVTALVYFVVQILFIYFLFESGKVDFIVGFNRHQIYLVFAFSQLIALFIFWFVSDNVRDVIRQLYEGGLDFFMIRPIDTRFIIMYQRFSGSFTVSIILYLLFLFPYLLLTYNYEFDIIDWLLVFYVLIVSAVIYAVLYWLAALVNFYWANFSAILLLINNISETSRYPRQVYPYVMQFLLTFIFPIFLVQNPIYNIMENSFTFEFGLQIGLITFVFCMIFLILWKDGLRRYNSAA